MTKVTPSAPVSSRATDRTSPVMVSISRAKQSSWTTGSSRTAVSGWILAEDGLRDTNAPSVEERKNLQLNRMYATSLGGSILYRHIHVPAGAALELAKSLLTRRRMKSGDTKRRSPRRG